MVQQITMRERMLAFFEDRELDRVPFVQYDIMVPAEQVWDHIGRDNIGLLRWVTGHRFENEKCSWESQDILVDGNPGQKNTIHTPAGDLTEIKHFEPTFGTPAIKEHFIKDLSDYPTFLSYLRDIRIVKDYSQIEQCIADMGQDGLPHCWVGRTPYQQMWSQWVSLENLALHMMDAPDFLEEVFSLLGRLLIEAVKILRDAPIPYFVIGDNITAPMIGEAYFRRYCLPYYNESADLLADRNIPLVVHMDGDLKPLWAAIGESKVTGLDSFSPPPDNDTRPDQALEMWPNKKLMLNFPSSVHLNEPEDIYAMAMDILQQAGHSGRLQIQISENVPPDVWKRSYPEIARAIQDFGSPNIPR